jgi:hypothetical protein
MLENTEGAIKNGQYIETGNIGVRNTKKSTTQYVLDTTICKQTQAMICYTMHQSLAGFCFLCSILIIIHNDRYLPILWSIFIFRRY